MRKRLVILVLALGFCLSPLARAANIIWVCENIDITADGVPDDFAWIPWVQSLGHTVDVRRGNWTTLDAAKIAQLNAADLIIISRTTSSGNYNNDATEISNWSGITKPIINLAAHFVRNNRWFWFNTDVINSIVGPMMEVVVPTHSIFTGVKLNAANQVVAVDGTTGTGLTSFIGTIDPGNGTLLAKTGNNAWIVEWQPGKPFYASSSQTPAGKRLFFSAGTQETAPQPQGALNLTEDGKKLLSNAILYMLGKSVVQGQAKDPTPALGGTDVPRDVLLGWTAGEFAQTHDVYVGLSFADVNTASRTNPLGVLAGQGRSDSRFAPALQFGQTYYWRVDEVNAPPSTNIVKGEIWSFTVEPFGYPIAPVKATASSAQAGMGPEKTIDGSGLDKSGLHGTEPTTMWTSGGAQPNWIQYEFDKVYKLHQLVVWNSNQLIESFLGFGAKKVTIETSVDGATWTPVASVPEFSQAPAAPGYAANTTVNLGSVDTKYVKLTINSNWGGLAPQAGLSEVRFSQVPVQARAPQPATAATGVGVDASLDWRPGRAAASHKVFFGTDPEAVAKGTASAKTLTTHGFTPDSLNFGTTYYWKVDEVNAVTYPGEVWNFTTQEFAAIDDFENYTDKAGEEVFTAWMDGFTSGTNGSTVGYMTAAGGTFGETKIVHGGKQSMPLAYDNTKAPNFSEAERTFSPVQDWTGNGAQELVVYFRGLAPGFVETAAGSILMNAIGTDIWNNGDQFRFAYKTLSGDGTMVARVDSVFNSNVWAKGGVMIRQSIQPGSTHAFMPITPGGAGAGNGASFQRRPTANGASANTDSTALVAAPYWVKIERKGNDFSGYISPDAKTWTQLGTAQTITMTNPVLIGLALCSHDAAIATSAAFANVSTTGNVTGTWQVAEIGAAQPAGNSVEGLYLSVKDSAGKTKVVQHPDTAATASMAWQQWTIPLSEFTSAGVKMTAVKSLTIGVGNKAAPKAGGTGTVYLDDIGYGHPASVPQANP